MKKTITIYLLLVTIGIIIGYFIIPYKMKTKTEYISYTPSALEDVFNFEDIPNVFVPIPIKEIVIETKPKTIPTTFERPITLKQYTVTYADPIKFYKNKITYQYYDPLVQHWKTDVYAKECPVKWYSFDLYFGAVGDLFTKPLYYELGIAGQIKYKRFGIRSSLVSTSDDVSMYYRIALFYNLF